MQDVNTNEIVPEAAGDINSLVTQIITAYTGHNTVSATELPQLVRELKQALLDDSVDHQFQDNLRPVGDSQDAQQDSFSGNRTIPDKPAVSVRSSIKPDGIISMIDGRKYKTLKRHLGTYGLTPDQYRARYNLPADYPMVAPEYSERRSELAKRMGLGTGGRRGSRTRRQTNNPAGKTGRN